MKVAYPMYTFDEHGKPVQLEQHPLPESEAIDILQATIQMLKKNIDTLHQKRGGIEDGR